MEGSYAIYPGTLQYFTAGIFELTGGDGVYLPVIIDRSLSIRSTREYFRAFLRHWENYFKMATNFSRKRENPCIFIYLYPCVLIYPKWKMSGILLRRDDTQRPLHTQI